MSSCYDKHLTLTLCLPVTTNTYPNSLPQALKACTVALLNPNSLPQALKAEREHQEMSKVGSALDAGKIARQKAEVTEPGVSPGIRGSGGQGIKVRTRTGQV